MRSRREARKHSYQSRRYLPTVLIFVALAGGAYAYTRTLDRNNPLPPPTPPPATEPVPQPPVDIDETPLPPPPPKEPVLSWYFTRSTTHQTPGYPREAKAILEKYPVYYVGDTSEKVLYLTFDEGYENGFTAPILDTLRTHGVEAAFFITDSYLKNNAALVDRMVAEGHIVGNHSVTHPSFPTLEDASVKSEVQVLEDHFRERTGRSMRYFRFPEGGYSERTVKLITDMGYKIVFWSLAYKDWDVKDQKGAQYAYDQVMANLHPGCILLLHAVSESNAGALDKILTDARAQGYRFVTLDELPGK